jgi:hypothetical protein
MFQLLLNLLPEYKIIMEVKDDDFDGHIELLITLQDKCDPTHFACVVHATACIFIRTYADPKYMKCLLTKFLDVLRPHLTEFVGMTLMRNSDETTLHLLDAGAVASPGYSAIAARRDIFFRILQQGELATYDIPRRKTALEIVISEHLDNYRAIALIKAGADLHVANDTLFARASFEVQAAMIDREPEYNWRLCAGYNLHKIRRTHLLAETLDVSRVLYVAFKDSHAAYLFEPYVIMEIVELILPFRI